MNMTGLFVYRLFTLQWVCNWENCRHFWNFFTHFTAQTRPVFVVVGGGDDNDVVDDDGIVVLFSSSMLTTFWVLLSYISFLVPLLIEFQRSVCLKYSCFFSRMSSKSMTKTGSYPLLSTRLFAIFNQPLVVITSKQNILVSLKCYVYLSFHFT